MTAADIAWIVYGVGFLIGWRIAFRTLLDGARYSPDEIMGYGIMAFFVALAWPVAGLLSDWRRWRFRS